MDNFATNSSTGEDLNSSSRITFSSKRKKRCKPQKRLVFSLSNFYDDEADVSRGGSEDYSRVDHDSACSDDASLLKDDSEQQVDYRPRFREFSNCSTDKQIVRLRVNDRARKYVESGCKSRKRKRMILGLSSSSDDL